MSHPLADTTAQKTDQPDAVYALAQSSDQLFAARLSGLYHSRDGGRSWRNAFESLDQSLAATAVAVTGNQVFAGVNGAVLRSEDAGASWSIAGLSSPAPHVVVLAISPNFADDGFIAAGTAEDGVFISDDSGATWTAWNFGLVDLHLFALAISPDFMIDRTLYAGTESGIFLSRNQGRSWHELPFPMESAPVLSLVVSPSFTIDGRLYAGTESHGLYISDDRGQQWQPVAEAVAEAVADARFEAAVNVIQISETDPASVLVLTEDRVLQTTNGGSSWQQAEGFSPGQLAMTMLVDVVENAVWVGFADGTVMQMQLPREKS